MDENQTETPSVEPQEAEETHKHLEHSFNLDEFLDLKDEDTAETIEPKIKEKLGIDLDAMREALSKATIERAEELTLEFPNIAPLGDYEKLIEDNDGMAEFLKTEAHKPEHWKLYGIKLSELQKDLIAFIFYNLGVDQGDSLKGLVFVTRAGKIKHAFSQYQD